MKFNLIRSQSIYQGRAFTVRQDDVLLPNGQSSQLDIVDHPGAVVLVPVDHEGNLWLVRQYRHAAGETMLELPAGTLEPGEDIESCAYRELREETGMSAGKISKIGEFYMAPGYSTEYLHIFLATDLKPDPLPGDEDEFIEVERLTTGQALAQAAQGQFRDAKTLAALLLAQPYLTGTVE
jgi:ADP-ribose pyrophosphatase